MVNRKVQKTKRDELDLQARVVKVKRVTKVIKGGRVLSFSALVVLGDKNGVVGCGFGKARDVAGAVNKATNKARNNLINVPLIKKTIPHAIRCKYKGSQVSLYPTVPGKGVIAGGPTRIVLESAGIPNVLGKIRGSNNPYNVTMATMQGLRSLLSAYGVARRRNISLDKVFNG